MRHSTRLCIGVFLVAASVRGQELRPAWDGTNLRVAAPKLSLLTGKVLEQLRHGRTIAFDFQLTLTSSPAAPIRAAERFVFSYDLWEERFSVLRLGRDRQPAKRVSNLLQQVAETWCLDNLVLPTAGVRPDQPLNLHLDIRAADSREDPRLFDDAGLSLTALVELFSRPARAQQAKWNFRATDVRLSDFRRKGS